MMLEVSKLQKTEKIPAKFTGLSKRKLKIGNSEEKKSRDISKNDQWILKFFVPKKGRHECSSTPMHELFRINCGRWKNNNQLSKCFFFVVMLKYTDLKIAWWMIIEDSRRIITLIVSFNWIKTVPTMIFCYWECTWRAITNATNCVLQIRRKAICLLKPSNEEKDEDVWFTY